MAISIIYIIFPKDDMGTEYFLKKVDIFAGILLCPENSVDRLLKNSSFTFLMQGLKFTSISCIIA